MTEDILPASVRYAIDEARDRFYDEHDEPDPPEFFGCCGACQEFSRCDIEGHEEVGWCCADHEFRLATDPDECDDW